MESDRVGIRGDKGVRRNAVYDQVARLHGCWVVGIIEIDDEIGRQDEYSCSRGRAAARYCHWRSVLKCLVPRCHIGKIRAERAGTNPANMNRLRSKHRYGGSVVMEPD